MGSHGRAGPYSSQPRLRLTPLAKRQSLMRTRSFLMAVVALSLVHIPAPAGAAEGVNLRWDQCFGDGGAQFRDFACDTNAGSERIVGSFALATDMPNVSGLELHLHVGS